MDMPIPFVEVPKVMHIGTLSKERRGSRFKESYEGNMLSVSTCPLAWRSIAKLGGSALWSLEKKDAVFLDVLELSKKKHSRLKRDIEEWGVSEGLCERKPAWRAWTEDCESEEWGFMTFPDEKSACEELGLESAADGAEDGPDGKPSVEKIEILALTPKGADRALQKVSSSDGFDMVASFWAEDVLRQAGVDVVGVWWKYAYDTDNLSAPCGGIFESCKDRFETKEIPWSEAEDVERLPKRRRKIPA